MQQKTVALPEIWVGGTVGHFFLLRRPLHLKSDNSLGLDWFKGPIAPPLATLLIEKDAFCCKCGGFYRTILKNRINYVESVSDHTCLRY
jgi:hypothetical protein